MNIDDIKFCYRCGELNPEYTIDEYRRICSCGEATVFSLTEVIDYLNQKHTYYGERIIPDDLIDEDFEQLELDFGDE